MPTKPPEKDAVTPLLSLSKVAAMLDVSVATLRKWREKNTMPFPAYLVGNQLRFKASEVWAAVENTKHHNTAEALTLRDSI